MKKIKNPIAFLTANKTHQGFRKKLLWTMVILTLSSTSSWAESNLSSKELALSAQRASTQTNCLNNVVARAKPNQVQLTWKDNGSSAYRIQRADQLAGPYSNMGDTNSTYSTWLDRTVVEGAEYFYKVSSLDTNGIEICSSGAVVSKVPPHIDPVQGLNRPPYFVSEPRLVAKIGIAYSYQVKALDADANELTYSLLEAPSGMTIDSKTGVINWQPSSNGFYDVIIEVTDPLDGKASQAYSIDVTVG